MHLIAEAGTNHNADPRRAERLIDAAVASGADSVKFQVIYPEGLYLPRFWRDGSYEDNAVFATRAAGMLSDDDYRALAGYAREKGIPMTASVFDVRGIRLLQEIDAPFIKLASVDLNDSPLIKEAAATGKKVILSTGMASLGEVERAVTDFLSTGNSDLVLMHCVSAYPCPLEGMNLGFLDVLRTFGLPIGLSDHTESSVAAGIAILKGVTWIEKHFTLNRKDEGFDHAYAMEPEMLTAYANDVRAAEYSIQPCLPKVQGAEAETKIRARRGLYAARDLKAGETLSAEDVLIVRPEGRLKPNDVYTIAGMTLTRDVHQYEELSWDQLR